MTIAVTMGDPAGIGPEIIVKAPGRLVPQLEGGELGLLVVGHHSAFEAADAAFDISGKGVTSEKGLVEAIEYAERLAQPRRGSFSDRA